MLQFEDQSKSELPKSNLTLSQNVTQSSQGVFHLSRVSPRRKAKESKRYNMNEETPKDWCQSNEDSEYYTKENKIKPEGKW